MSQGEKPETEWVPLYRMGSLAALASVAIVPIATVIFVALPPPSFQPTASAVRDWFAVFQVNPLLGVLDGDLLLMIGELLLVPLYLALYVGLSRLNPSLMLAALAFGLIGVAAYVASNPAFSLLSLSSQYAATSDPTAKSQLVAAGQTLLAIYQGTPYDLGYVLGGVAILIMNVVMLRSSLFSKGTAYSGIALGVLSLVPGSAGTIGLVFAFSSLIPDVMWEIQLARTFFQLGRA